LKLPVFFLFSIVRIAHTLKRELQTGLRENFTQRILAQRQALPSERFL